MALPFDKEDQAMPAMSHQPSPSPTGGHEQGSTTTNTTKESDVKNPSKRSEAAPTSKSKDKRAMAPPSKPPTRRKRAPGPPPEPKDKRPPLPPGGPRTPYDWIWDREILEAYLYLYEPRVDYEDAAKSLGCSGRALEEHLKQVKKRATAKFEAGDPSRARGLRAQAQGLPPPTADEATKNVPAPKRRTRVPGRGRGRPRKVDGMTATDPRKRVGGDEDDDEEGEGEGQVTQQSPRKKVRGEDGLAVPPGTPSSHSKRHRKTRHVASSPPPAAAAAADEEEEEQGEGEQQQQQEEESPTKKAKVAVPMPDTPSRKRVASAEAEDASPAKKTATSDVAVTPEQAATTTPVGMNSGVAGSAQVDGGSDDSVGGRTRQKEAVGLPTIGDLLAGLEKREGGSEARMRFEDSMLGNVQDVAIREGKLGASGLQYEGKEEGEEEEEEEEQRMQEGMGQVEMTFE